MGVYKTTKRHFEIFKKEAEYWIKVLGLTDWRIDIVHKNSPDGNNDCRAWYGGKIDDRVAEIGLAVDWTPDKITNCRIRESAFHEVCHLVLAELEGIIEKVICVKEADKQIHIVIRRLESLFYGNEKKKV